MNLDFGETVALTTGVKELDFVLPRVPPTAAPNVVRISGNISIGALSRDQYLALGLNGDFTAGQYSGYSVDYAPGQHSDVLRSLNNALIAGYTGWGKDADLVFDLVLSISTGVARSASGSYTTVHSDGRQYLSQIGGVYFDKVTPITSFKLVLPQGGIINGGALMVTKAA